jgi:hypothetical protein
MNELASLIVPPKQKRTESTSPLSNKHKSFSNDSTILKSYSGDYISDDGYLLNISWKGGKLLGSGFGQNFQTVGKEKSNTFLFPSKNNPLTKILGSYLKWD